VGSLRERCSQYDSKIVSNFKVANHDCSVLVIRKSRRCGSCIERKTSVMFRGNISRNVGYHIDRGLAESGL
jgi:hypothetical protein